MLKQKTFVVKIESMGGNNRTNRSGRSGSANKSSSQNGKKRTSKNQKSAKSSAKRTGSGKRAYSKTSKRKSKKVFIPADKIILFCGCVVLFCAILLVLTQATDSRKDAEIKNEFEKITKSERLDKAVPETSAAEKENKSVIEPSAAEPRRSIEVTGNSNVNSVAEKSAANIAMAKHPDNDVGSRISATEQDKKVVEQVVPKGAQEITKQEKKAVEALETTENKTSITNEFSFVSEAKNNAVLVFVFDDGGQNLSQLEKVLALPFPVTVAVLPGLAHSKASAEKVRRSGNELILHQPMQAVNLNVNPGPGAITPSMNEEEIRSVLFRNIYEIGPVKGVNNHEGSLITADAEKMSHVMKLLSDEGLYFLDSRTNAGTKVPFVAESLGYSYYERNVFLDNTKVRSDILGEIKKGLDYANRTGCAIMIGHVWSAEILPAILNEIYPVLVKNGYRFSTVSDCPARIN